MANQPQRMIRLPGFTASHFTIYYLWLLTGRLYTRCIPDSTEIQRLVCAHAVGWFLEDDDYTDNLVDAIMQCCTEDHEDYRETIILSAVGLYESALGFPGTVHPFIDLVAWFMYRDGITILWIRGVLADLSLQGDLPSGGKEFVAALFQRVAAVCVSEDPPRSPLVGWESTCKYHGHGEEQMCYRKKVNKFVKAIH